MDERDKRNDETIALRRRIAAIGNETPAKRPLFRLGAASIDDMLGGLACGAIHEIYALDSGHAAAATGFATALALRAAGDRKVVWTRQDCLDAELGGLHAPGLSEFGLDPGRLVLIRARDAAGVLRAGFEALCCGALGAVIVEIWGTPKVLDLTAGRKLLLAARRSGVTLFMVHVAAEQRPSPAETRWLVAASPSQPLEANAPGLSSFAVTLLRHRAGFPVHNWRLEWNRDQCSFAERISSDRVRIPAERQPGLITPLSRPLVSLPADRPAAPERPAAAQGAVRRAG